MPAERSSIPDRLATLENECARLQFELDLRNHALDAATAHFMIIDMLTPGHPVVFVNRALAQNHGYEQSELLGASATKLVAVELCPEQLQELNDAMRHGRTIRTELRSSNSGAKKVSPDR